MPPFNFTGQSNPNYIQSGWASESGSPFANSQSNQIYTPAFNLQNYDENRRRIWSGYDQSQGRGIAGDVRERQRGLADMLQQQAMGQGPSVATEQLKMGQNRNLSQQQAAAASMRGRNVGLGQRLIQQQAGQANQEVAAQSAAMRAQEQMGAREQLAGVLQQEGALELGIQQANDQMTQFYLNQGMSYDLAQSQANMDLQRMFSENYNQTAATMASMGNSIRAAKAQKYAAPWGILSDENLKTNVKKGKGEVADFLESVRSLNAYGNPARSALVGGIKALGEKATSTGSPVLGQTLGEVGSFIASPKQYLIGKGIEGVKAVANALSGSGAASAVKGASGAGSGAAGGAAAKSSGASGAGGGTTAGDVASAIGQVAGGLISGTRSTAGTYQNKSEVYEPMNQRGGKYLIPVDENDGEIANNQGIIGAIVSALTSSGISMKENIEPAQGDLQGFLQSQPSQAPTLGSSRQAPMVGSTIPRHQVQETGQRPMYTSGVLETAGDSIGGGRSNMWTTQRQDAVARSDEKKKKDVTTSQPSLQEFLNNLEAFKYDYKNPDMDGHGKQFGVMAQDIEKSPVGASFVIDTPRGKMVDYGKGFGVILAAQSMLNERLNKLEGGKR